MHRDTPDSEYWTRLVCQYIADKTLHAHTALEQLRRVAQQGRHHMKLKLNARLENRKRFKILFKLLYLRFPPLQIRTCVFSRLDSPLSPSINHSSTTPGLLPTCFANPSYRIDRLPPSGRPDRQGHSVLRPDLGANRFFLSSSVSLRFCDVSAR